MTLTDPTTSPGEASARRAARFERRLSSVERRPGPIDFTDTGPTGAGNPPKPSGSPPNGTIATGYYPNKTAGFRTWQWARANGEWYGVNAGA
jgi:hypothetical protein